MAKRDIREKRLRRIEKLTLRSPLARYINLVEWLLDRGHADTSGGAQRLLLDGKVKASSHVVGRKDVPTMDYSTGKVTDIAVVDPILPASLKSELVVSS